MDDRHRCRWCNDAPAGRCPHAQAFPAVAGVPPFCLTHLAVIEPWATARARLSASGAPAWIDWARRNAADAQAARTMLGERPATRRGVRAAASPQGQAPSRNPAPSPQVTRTAGR